MSPIHLQQYEYRSMKTTKIPFSHRRKSRELLLQALFQSEFVNNAKLDDSLKNLKALFGIDPEAYQYAECLAQSYDLHKPDIDALLKDLSNNWSLERMATVDKNILRLALVELKYFEGTPPQVVIDEAIEIAKKYGSTDSASFVNGLLDKALKG